MCGTAIARQPRSSVPTAIHIVFIAHRAVSIHFYHCYTIFPTSLILLLLLFPLLLCVVAVRPEANIDSRMNVCVCVYVYYICVYIEIYIYIYIDITGHRCAIVDLRLRVSSRVHL